MYKLLVFLFLLPTFIMANTSVAKITSLKGSAHILRQELKQEASLGIDLIKHDSVYTHANSKVQIIFQDETIMSIGKNSHFAIDEYINDGDKSEAKFSLFKGAMRAVTGKIGKINPKKFKVKTKTATIGIRGTNFIVVVTPGENDIVACTLGGITVQGTQGEEVNVPTGFLIQVSVSGEVSEPQSFTPDELSDTLENGFETEQDEEGSDSTEQTQEDGQVQEGDSQFFSEVDSVADGSTGIVQNTIVEEVNDIVEDSSLNVVTQSTPVILSGFSSSAIIFGNTFATLTNVGDGSKGTVAFGIDALNQVLLGSPVLVIDNAGDIDTTQNYPLNPQLSSYVSPYSFSTNFLNLSFTSSAGTQVLDSSRAAQNYFRTLSDLDANDEITWGEWSVPLVNTGSGAKTINAGHFILGEFTPTSVIDGFKQANLTATYTGSLIGRSNQTDVEGPKSSNSFTGNVSSVVDFGRDSVSSTLSFNTNGDAYTLIIGNQISGNTFSYTSHNLSVFQKTSTSETVKSEGAFYGADGKTLGAQFLLNHSIGTIDRKITGAYQAKTP